MKTIPNNHFEVLEGDCLKILKEGKVKEVDLTFLDPSYDQGKDYRFFDDNQSEINYWNFMEEVLAQLQFQSLIIKSEGTFRNNIKKALD